MLCTVTIVFKSSSFKIRSNTYEVKIKDGTEQSTNKARETVKKTVIRNHNGADDKKFKILFTELNFKRTLKAYRLGVSGKYVK